MRSRFSFFHKNTFQTNKKLPKLTKAQMKVAHAPHSAHPDPLQRLNQLFPLYLEEKQSLIVYDQRVLKTLIPFFKVPSKTNVSWKRHLQRKPHVAVHQFTISVNPTILLTRWNQNELFLILFLFLFVYVNTASQTAMAEQTDQSLEMCEDKILQEAYQLLRNDKINAAINLFEKLININPKNIIAYEGLIECFIVNNDLKKVYYWLEDAEKNQCNSKRLNLLLKAANELSDLFNISEYIAGKILGKIPETLGKIYLKEALETDNFYENHNVIVAINYFLEAKKIAAQQLLAVTIELQQHSERTSVKENEPELDKIHSLERKLFNIIINYNQTIILSTLTNLATYYALTDEYEIAVACLSEFLSLRKDNELYFPRGLYLKELGKYKEALADFDQALTSANALEIHKVKGSVLLHSQFFEQAIESFKKAIEAANITIENEKNNKLKCHSLIGLGLSYLNLHEDKLAMYCFDRAFKMDPNNAENHSAIAIGYFNTDYSKRPLALKLQEDAIRLANEKPEQYSLSFRIGLYDNYVEMLYLNAKNKHEVKDKILFLLDKASQLIDSHRLSSKDDINSFQENKRKIENAKKFYNSEYATDVQFTLSKLCKKLNKEVNQLNEQHESALILAIKSGQVQTAQMLLSEGAAINFSTLQKGNDGNFNYTTAIEMAKKLAISQPDDPNKWLLLENLLRNREKFSANQIAPYLKIISSNQQANELDLAAKNETALAINLLIQGNVSDRMKQYDAHKYLGHLMDRSGTIDEVNAEITNNDELHRYELSLWGHGDFYELHLNSYLRIYTQNINKKLDEHSADPREIFEHKQMQEALHREILLDLETLRCKRDGDVVRDIIKNGNISNKIKDKIKKAHLDNIKSKIINLNENETYVLYAEIYKRHGLYINFSYDKKTGLIHRRIDNLGESSEKHLHDNEKIWPCQLTPLTKQQLSKYLLKVYNAKYNFKEQSESTFSYKFFVKCYKEKFDYNFLANKKRIVSYIKNNYRTTKSPAFDVIDDYANIYNSPCSKPTSYAPSRKKQSVSNCVYKNKSVGEEIRMSCYLHAKIKEAEISMAQELDRKIKQNYQKLFNESKYSFDMLDTKPIHIINLSSFKI